MNLLSGAERKLNWMLFTASLVTSIRINIHCFNPQERLMIERVLNLNQRSANGIMTSRHDISASTSVPEGRDPQPGGENSIPVWWSPASER